MTTNNILVFAKKSVPAFLVLAIAGIAVSMPRSVAAQTTTQPFNDSLSGDSRGDVFSGRGNGQTNSMFDIIHRAMQGQGLSSEDFNEEQQENLDDAAAQFRKLQQQQLQKPTATSSTPAASTTTKP